MKVVVIQEGIYQMAGKLSAARAEVGLPPFIGNQNLVDASIVFCVKDIRMQRSNLGPQWVMEAQVTPSSIEHLVGKVQGVTETTDIITVGLSCEKSRDKLMPILQTDLPVHSCYLVEVRTGNKRPFFDLKEYPGICPCGDTSCVPTEEELAEQIEGQVDYIPQVDGLLPTRRPIPKR